MQKDLHDGVSAQGLLVLGDFDTMGVSFCPIHGPDATFDRMVGEREGGLFGEFKGRIWEGNILLLRRIGWLNKNQDDQRDISILADG